MACVRSGMNVGAPESLQFEHKTLLKDCKTEMVNFVSTLWAHFMLHGCDYDHVASDQPVHLD